MTDIRNSLPRNGTQDSPHTVGQIQKIIVHHDAEWRSADYDSVQRYISQARYHINSGEDGLQYHYKIDNVGEVFQCRDLTDTLWHCGNYPINRTSIAICVDGNFQNQMPTREQFIALKNLLDELCTKHPEFPADEGQVFGHQEVAATACPGNNLIGFIKGYRVTGINTEIPNVPYNNGTLKSEPVAVQPPVVIQPVPVVTPVPITPTKYTGDTTEPVKPETTPTTTGVVKEPQNVPTQELDTKEKKGDIVSPKFSLNKNDLLKIGKGALIALAGALGTYLLTLTNVVDAGIYTPLLVAGLSIVANTLVKFASGK